MELAKNQKNIPTAIYLAVKRRFLVKLKPNTLKNIFCFTDFYYFSRETLNAFLGNQKS